MAVSELAPEPVSFYAAVFFLVNVTYMCLLLGRLSETGGSGSGDPNISFAFEVAHGQRAASIASTKDAHFRGVPAAGGR